MEKVHKFNEVLMSKMLAHFDAYNYSLAMDLGRSLVESARRLEDSYSEKQARRVLAFSSLALDDFGEAMANGILYQKRAEKTGDVKEQLEARNLLTILFIMMDDFRHAEDLLLASAGQLSNINDLVSEGWHAYCWGRFYLKQGLEDRAKVFFEKALAAGLQEERRLMCQAYLGLGSCYIKEELWEEAKQNLREGEHLAIATKDQKRLCQAHRLKALMFKGMQRWEEVRDCLEQAKAIADQRGYLTELSEVTYQEAGVCHYHGEHEAAYETLMIHMGYVTQLDSRMRECAVVHTKLTYDVTRRGIEADILRGQNAILEESNRKIQEQTREMERLNEMLGRQNDDLHQSAIEDYLTGVYNRKYFAMKLEEEFSIAKENGGDLACIIFDIDKFKNVNDTYGHLVGDEMIKHVSSVCEESLDTDSVIGRFGGDEFMILMVDADIEEAQDKAEELRDILSASPLIHDKQVIYATLSLGVADNHYLSPKTADEMMHIADEGLYVAKEKGRNQSAVFVPENQ